MTNKYIPAARPDYGTAVALQRKRNIDAVVKMAIATAQGAAHKMHQKDVVKTFYPNDKNISDLLVTKAGVTPATMTTASTLLGQGVVLDLAILGPQNAAAQILQAGMQFRFGDMALIQVPAVVVDPTVAGFVGEGAPIPAKQLNLTGGVLLAPRKFAVLTVFNREVFEHSQPNIENIVRAAITEATAGAFDAAFFDATAGDATRPPGIRNGVAALGGESANPDLTEAMKADIGALTAAVAPISGNTPPIVVCNVAQAWRLKYGVWPSGFGLNVLTSSAVAAGDVLMIVPNAIASACDPVPSFESSTQAVVHMSDAAGEIGTTGTLIGGGAEGGNVKSLWQVDAVSLRMICGVSWGLRDSGGLAWLDNCSW